MKIHDLHQLPKFRDGLSYLYVEHCKIDQESQSIAIHDQSGMVPVPCANLALVLIGPGVSITHAAITALADNGCLAAWCGEGGVRYYASGMGETRSSANLLHQARKWADEKSHMDVIRRMYQMRFSDRLEESLTLRQIRGKEGLRVREAYARASETYGVPWDGRNYNRSSWEEADTVNKALSVANSCLYGICHAAIVTAGFSPALGFIHTGNMLSFVYDVADLYKTEITIPLAFEEVAKSEANLERRIRRSCRDRFVSNRLLERIIPDIQSVLMLPKRGEGKNKEETEEEPPPAGWLWEPNGEFVEGGRLHSTNEEGETTANDGADT